MNSLWIHCIECNHRLARNARQCPRCQLAVFWCGRCKKRIKECIDGISLCGDCFIQSEMEQSARLDEKARAHLKFLKSINLEKALHCAYCNHELQQTVQNWARTPSPSAERFSEEGPDRFYPIDIPPSCENCGSITPLGSGGHYYSKSQVVGIDLGFEHCVHCLLPIIPRLQSFRKYKHARPYQGWGYVHKPCE